MRNKTISKIIWVFAILFMLTACGGEADKEDENITETAEEDVTSAPAMITDAVNDQEPSDSVGISAADTVSDEEKLREKIAGMQIKYEFGDNIETLDGSQIKDWLITLPDGSLSVNEAPAKEYIAGLATKYDTFGKTRSFTTHAGDTISIAGGNYGYWMDRVNTRYELIDCILTGESAEMEPVYYGKGKQFGTDDIGNTYVEINIGDQHLWVYKDGKVVNESDFVSGGLFKGNNTPDGVFAITYKEKDATLVGENYESSVKYWMPFNGNIGMHDAPWRDSFGGHIYYMKGSHGCINLPSSKAAEIYDQVDKGEAVIVYGGISTDVALTRMTLEEQVEAFQKGYIPMTTEVAAYLLQQQGMDPSVANAVAGATVSAQEAAAAQQQTDATQQPEGQQPADVQQQTEGQQEAVPAETATQ